jgi:hypothetical protein
LRVATRTLDTRLDHGGKPHTLGTARQRMRPTTLPAFRPPNAATNGSHCPPGRIALVAQNGVLPPDRDWSSKPVPRISSRTVSELLEVP